MFDFKSLFKTMKMIKCLYSVGFFSMKVKKKKRNENLKSLMSIYCCCRCLNKGQFVLLHNENL